MKDFKNILYAIDLDDDNSVSIVYAMEFAQLLKSRVHILYINDREAGYRHPTDREDTIALKVKKSVPESLLESSDIVYAASKGDPADEIVKYAGKNGIELIIVGHKHRNKLFSSMFDSTDVNIIDVVKLPVLVIPED
jgi:nucleotide-binding universal stress UspA family protein